MPFSLSPNAICVATVLLPTPPFPDNTKITCLTPDKWSDKFAEIIHVHVYIYINIEIIAYLKIDSTSNGFLDTIYKYDNDMMDKVKPPKCMCSEAKTYHNLPVKIVLSCWIDKNGL